MKLLKSLKRPIFWNFGLLNFFYFAVWQFSGTFLPMWLKSINVTPTYIGLLNTVAALAALVLQPVFGPLQDKLGLKKNLFFFVVCCILFAGPLFNWVFLPILKVNELLGALLVGIYLSLCLNGGSGVVEAYNERSSRANGFEYGHARLFGSLAGACASFVGGFMWSANKNSIFWGMTFCGAVLIVLLLLVRVPKNALEAAEDIRPSTSDNTDEAPELTVTKEDFARNTWRNRSFWGFVLLIIGSATMYDVFDQQFANYFSEMFVRHGMGTLAQGNSLFAKVVSVQILLEACFMLIMPALIDKIGAKTGLIIYGGILFVRVLGCAFITNVPMLIFWRLLASLEMPFMLISVMKYITRVFDKKVSATVYMYGFGTAKQIGVSIFSLVMGAVITTLQFQKAYMVLAAAIFLLVAIGASLMRSDVKLVRANSNVAAK